MNLWNGKMFAKACSFVSLVKVVCSLAIWVTKLSLLCLVRNSAVGSSCKVSERKISMLASSWKARLPFTNFEIAAFNKKWLLLVSYNGTSHVQQRSTLSQSQCDEEHEHGIVLFDNFNKLPLSCKIPHTVPSW